MLLVLFSTSCTTQVTVNNQVAGSDTFEGDTALADSQAFETPNDSEPPDANLDSAVDALSDAADGGPTVDETGDVGVDAATDALDAAPDATPDAGPVNLCPPDSCDDANTCTLDTCSPATGACTYVPLNAFCSDENACTLEDKCDATGTCLPGAVTTCQDSNSCTTDSCEPVKGCLHMDKSGPCDDGDPCTNADQCAGGVCVPAGTFNCNDNNPCTIDSCSPKSWCKNVPLPTGVTCDDGSVCTTGDHCEMDGLYKAVCTGALLDCNDKNLCTWDSCDAKSGCTHGANDSASCSDGKTCTSSDKCVSGQCQGIPLICGTSGDPACACVQGESKCKVGCK